MLRRRPWRCQSPNSIDFAFVIVMALLLPASLILLFSAHFFLFFFSTACNMHEWRHELSRNRRKSRGLNQDETTHWKKKQIVDETTTSDQSRKSKTKKVKEKKNVCSTKLNNKCPLYIHFAHSFVMLFSRLPLPCDTLPRSLFHVRWSLEDKLRLAFILPSQVCPTSFCEWMKYYSMYWRVRYELHWGTCINSNIYRRLEV